MVMYSQNGILACKESRQSPSSLQPCWGGEEGGYPTICETTTTPIKTHTSRVIIAKIIERFGS